MTHPRILPTTGLIVPTATGFRLVACTAEQRSQAFLVLTSNKY